MTRNINTRVRRAKKTRIKIRLQSTHRLMVYKTPRHTYAQVVSPDGSKIIACASTLGKVMRDKVKHGGNIESAKIVGRLIAEKSIQKGISIVAFDRSGFKYHGRIKALAEEARNAGLQF
ncbi:MAG: 50S ribosomal protein L18 [Methylacidiphilales bacterium]|nr:50S ribosomal protein L18 [Candidatus Methylacidiphilales bacterium]